MKPTVNIDRLKRLWRDHIKPLGILFLVMFMCRWSFADWYHVPTGSMKPTIVEGDRVFANKLAYDLKVPFTYWRLARWSTPNRGDVVVLLSPYDGKRLVKRVIGLPGDTVSMLSNRLLVNGVAVTYEPLSASVLDQRDTPRSPVHRVAREHLEGRPHLVMTTPARRVRRSFAPVTIPPGQCFVMGDNRDNSFDSRGFGFVRIDRIVGRVDGIFYSLNPDSYYLPRLGRFFSPLR